MEELLPTRADQAVVGVATGRLVAGRIRDEGAALLHAGQHAGNALVILQAAVEGLDELLLAHASGRRRWRGHDRNARVIGDAAYPRLVDLGALLEDSRVDASHAEDVVEEIDQALWTLEPLE